MNRSTIRGLLEELGSLAVAIPSADLTLVGGAAGMLTGFLPPARTTLDCDVIRTEPAECFELLKPIAAEMANRRNLPADWFSDQVADLDVLPLNWRRRRIHIGDFGPLHVWSVGRLDLLATKLFAGRMQDRADVIDMHPTKAELEFVRKYLDQLRIPSRKANLDQVQSALRFLSALEAEQ